MSDEEEYEFDYSDEDDEMEGDADADVRVQIENQYYSAKQYLECDPPEPREALAALVHVVELQGDEQTDWGFKALKRIVKLYFELNEHDQAMKRYEELLGYTKSAVTRNVGEKGINGILDFVSTSKVGLLGTALVGTLLLICGCCRTGRSSSASTRRRWKRSRKHAMRYVQVDELAGVKLTDVLWPSFTSAYGSRRT